ncbi:MAG TPA: TIR domain-containing protein [Pseudonocardiaceae bacterium]|nr:TIR domain-containing protein [Pseudonocardiaceae bacterium]
MSDYEIDVCLSFAGEQRPYVVQVAEALRDRDVVVFYDGYEEADLWGRDLYEHLDSIYRNRSRFCILFVSEDYARKVWTTHERQSAQARALQENVEYILPVRFDETDIPGIRPTLGYIDLRVKAPSELADLVIQKLESVGRRKPKELVAGPVYSTVPTTDAERATLVELRPSGWEHFLFGGVIVEIREKLRSKRRDYDIGYAEPVRRLATDRDTCAYMSERIHYALKINSNIMQIIDKPAQVNAFGVPGEPGDVENIIHLARRLGDSYEAYFDWASDIRGSVTDAKFNRVFELLARAVGGSIRGVENFIDEYASSLPGLPERLAAGGPVTVEVHLTLEQDEDVTDELEREMELLGSIIDGANLG